MIASVATLEKVHADKKEVGRSHEIDLGVHKLILLWHISSPKVANWPQCYI